ncbi:hypothetical protein ACLB2K_017186 [Fragaria x ananassa]
MFRQAEIFAVRNKLNELLAAPFDLAHNEEKKALNTKLQELLTTKKTIWIQRLKSLWLKARDRNTTFFHRRASNRKQRNTIKGLNNSNGVWVMKPNEIEEIVTSYYNSLFETEGVNGNTLNIILNTVQSKVTPAMNHDLLASYQDSEIKTALFQMHPSKVPGPGGMSPFFFQKYWHVVGRDVCIAVKSFLSSGVLPGDLNFTFVTLILKVKTLKDMTQLRPIALCNVLYRICSKILANRLKRILDKVISSLQSAFVPGRLNIDNTLVANELEWEFVGGADHDNFDNCELFLFEGLSSLIQHLATNRGIQGMKLSYEATSPFVCR